MGQYYKIVNLDKKEYLHPHHCGDGLKLMEFGLSGNGTMACLAILLADGNGRGGGDLHSDNPIIGSWAGDRIVIAGDYADKNRWGANRITLYEACEDEAEYKNVTEEAMLALTDDRYVAEDLSKSVTNWSGDMWRQYAPRVYTKLKAKADSLA